MNPLDLMGPQFLTVYIVVLVVGTLVALGLRNTLRPPAGDVDARSLHLRPLEAAYLAGGARGAVLAVVAALAQRDLVEVDATTYKLSAKSQPASDAEPLEKSVHLAMETSGTTVDMVIARVGKHFETLRPNLEDLGLVMREGDAWKARLVPALVIGAVFLFGAVRLATGLSRGRPVLFLFLLLFVTAMGILVLAVVPPVRSRRGDNALIALRRSNSALQTVASIKPARLSPEDLALAIGLFGPTVVSKGPLASLGRALLRPQASPSMSSCSSSSCSSGSSCGGGCGGGGCGGCGS